MQIKLIQIPTKLSKTMENKSTLTIDIVKLMIVTKNIHKQRILDLNILQKKKTRTHFQILC